jgi:hypothetical protein
MNQPGSNPHVVAFLLAGFLSCVACRAEAQDVERLTPFSGSKLTGEVFLCTSNQNAAGGFWRDPVNNTVEQGASIQRQTGTTTWRITLRRDRAEVVRFSGASQTLEEPEVYSLEETPTGGLLMVPQNRPPGFSPQIITIDPTNSSFVYSSQHVSNLYNRANVLYGSCRPYI